MSKFLKRTAPKLAKHQSFIKLDGTGLVFRDSQKEMDRLDRDMERIADGLLLEPVNKTQLDRVRGTGK